MHTAGTPSSRSFGTSQLDQGPVSITTRRSPGARLRKVAAIASGSVAQRPRQTTTPVPSSTQTWVSLSEMSKPQ